MPLPLPLLLLRLMLLARSGFVAAVRVAVPVAGGVWCALASTESSGHGSRSRSRQIVALGLSDKSIDSCAPLTVCRHPLSQGSYFNDINNPKPVVQLGRAGERGSIEWSDTIVSTQGQQRGAILFEYNINSPASSPPGLFDVHPRIGRFAGSNLQLAQCPKTPDVTVTADNLNQQCGANFSG